MTIAQNPDASPYDWENVDCLAFRENVSLFMSPIKNLNISSSYIRIKRLGSYYNITVLKQCM